MRMLSAHFTAQDYDYHLTNYEFKVTIGCLIMTNNVFSQNGALLTSWLSDHTEKPNYSMVDNSKDTVNV